MAALSACSAAALKIETRWSSAGPVHFLIIDLSAYEIRTLSSFNVSDCEDFLDGMYHNRRCPITTIMEKRSAAVAAVAANFYDYDTGLVLGTFIENGRMWGIKEDGDDPTLDRVIFTLKNGATDVVSRKVFNDAFIDSVPNPDTKDLRHRYISVLKPNNQVESAVAGQSKRTHAEPYPKLAFCMDAPKRHAVIALLEDASLQGAQQVLRTEPVSCSAETITYLDDGTSAQLAARNGSSVETANGLCKAEHRTFGKGAKRCFNFKPIPAFLEIIPKKDVSAIHG